MEDINKKEDNNTLFFGVISSLKLFNNKYLFAGHGSHLKIFDIKIKELTNRYKIFESAKISKINIFSFSNINPIKTYLLVLSGETKIKYSFFTENEFLFTFNLLQTKSNDYIMDHILYSLDNTNNYLIIGFINNFIEIYSINSNNIFIFKKYLFSPVKCIVYSMAFTLSNNSIMIASGTVFRQIIIWKINYNNDFIKDNNSLILKGHEGVVFSVHFNDDNKLCSTSDDRTTKLWKFDFNTKKYIYDDFKGHASRVWDSIIYNNLLISISEDATALLYDLNTKIV